MDVTMAVQAFKIRLQRDSPFYQELVMNPCGNLDEVRNKALRFIGLEDDKKIQERIESSSRYNHPNRKSTPTYEPYKHKPYARPDNKKVNVVKVTLKNSWAKRNQELRMAATSQKEQHPHLRMLVLLTSFQVDQTFVEL